jgi:hypothetical protein
MVKLQSILVIFLLLTGGVCASAQRAGASVELDQAIINAGSWMKTHLVPGTKDVVLHFSAPTRELIRYVTESLITLTASAGISVVVINGVLSATEAREFGWRREYQTLVTGSITRSDAGYQLDFRAVDIDTDKIVSRYPALIRMDPNFRALLHPRQVRPPTAPAARPAPPAKKTTSTKKAASAKR